MKTKKPIINIRGMDCPPEFEEKFNKWYNEVHIPMMLKSGEIKEVTRFKRIGNDENYPKYLAIYDYEDQQAFERLGKSRALAEALEETKQSWPNPDESYQHKWWVQYEAIKTWKK